MNRNVERRRILHGPAPRGKTEGPRRPEAPGGPKYLGTIRDFASPTAKACKSAVQPAEWMGNTAKNSVAARGRRLGVRAWRALPARARAAWDRRSPPLIP